MSEGCSLEWEQKEYESSGKTKDRPGRDVPGLASQSRLVRNESKTKKSPKKNLRQPKGYHSGKHRKLVEGGWRGWFFMLLEE